VWGGSAGPRPASATANAGAARHLPLLAAVAGVPVDNAEQIAARAAHPALSVVVGLRVVVTLAARLRPAVVMGGGRCGTAEDGSAGHDGQGGGLGDTVHWISER